MGLNLHVYRDQMVLSLDSSGESLHSCGYRPIQQGALNEALAAALILSLAGGATGLADPLCGSEYCRSRRHGWHCVGRRV